jgi:hypothetical protein
MILMAECQSPRLKFLQILFHSEGCEISAVVFGGDGGVGLPPLTFPSMLAAEHMNLTPNPLSIEWRGGFKDHWRPV